MRIGKRTAEWLASLVFLAVTALVFQQVATDMTKQGIASGGPYDNAATYPRAVAICLLVLVLGQIVIQASRRRGEASETTSWRELARPATVLATFITYAMLLGPFGYYLTTLTMLVCLMVTCGLRRPMPILATAVVLSVGLAWTFEDVLLVTLPGGIFDLHANW